MATNFPTSLDTLTNPTSTDGLNNPSHSSQHANANDAIEALEAKVGVNSSAVTTSLDYLTTQANAFGSSGFASGTYYGPVSRTNTVGTQNRTLNQVAYSPFFVDRQQSFDRIAIRTGGGLTGTLTVRLGIYNNTNKQPSTVLLDAGTVACTLSSTIYSITINQALSPGWYWLAAVAQSATGTTNTTTLQTISDLAAFNQGILNQTTFTCTSTYVQSGVTGAFDTATSLTATSATVTLVALRAV